MDKILQSMSSRDGSISVTNDGATILRSIHVDNAAAKVLVDIAKTQDDEVSCLLALPMSRDLDRFCLTSASHGMSNLMRTCVSMSLTP